MVQADGQVKNRPALVQRVMPGFGDLLLCGFCSQLNQQVSGFDEIISPSDVDFAFSGLTTTRGFGSASPRLRSSLILRSSLHGREIFLFLPFLARAGGELPFQRAGFSPVN
jgi:hypothetical protein